MPTRVTGEDEDRTEYTVDVPGANRSVVAEKSARGGWDIYVIEEGGRRWVGGSGSRDPAEQSAYRIAEVIEGVLTDMAEGKEGSP